MSMSYNTAAELFSGPLVWQLQSDRYEIIKPYIHVVLLLYVVACTVMNITSLSYFYYRTTLQEDNILPLLDTTLKPDDEDDENDR